MFLISMGVIVYHLTAIFKKTIRARNAQNECHTSLVQPTEPALPANEMEITYSIVKIPNDSLTDNANNEDLHH